MHYVHKLLLSLFLSFFSLSCLATATHVYEIELIVFSHINAPGVNSETWPLLGSPQLNLTNAWTLQPLDDTKQNKNAAPIDYSLLPNYDFNLNQAAERLVHSPNYQTILHAAWRQPVQAAHDAKWIHIYGGAGYDEEGNVVAQDRDGSVPYDQAAHWQVDGLVRFDVQRYFNTRYQLGFAAPAGQIQDLSTTDNFANIDNPLLYFKLDQFRRMKSKELNYIGHPLYGVLVYITPIK